jgi:hypothetical protein
MKSLQSKTGPDYTTTNKQTKSFAKTLSNGKIIRRRKRYGPTVVQVCRSSKVQISSEKKPKLVKTLSGFNTIL